MGRSQGIPIDRATKDDKDYAHAINIRSGARIQKQDETFQNFFCDEDNRILQRLPDTNFSKRMWKEVQGPASGRLPCCLFKKSVGMMR